MVVTISFGDICRVIWRVLSVCNRAIILDNDK